MPNFNYGICLIALLSLFGCAKNLREEPPETFAEEVKKSVTTLGNETVWSSPELEVSHYRALFYGYDILQYRLFARKSPNGKASFQITIDASYGGKLRHYNAVKFSDGSSRPMEGNRHDTQRCQFFNSMVYACLFRDQARLNLPRADFEAARVNGLRLILSSGNEDYETIELPGNYIQGFLMAVR